MEKSNHIYDHKLFPKKRRNASGKKNAPPYRPYDFDDFLSDVGNREIARLFGAGDAAAKLKVGDPGDAKEREADKIANEVVKNEQPPDPGSVQKQAGISDSTETSAANRKAADLMGSGKQLDSNLKSYFEPRFGVDLDKVRIHTDEKANRLSAYIHARALALGNNIAFAKGEYKPETIEGKKLLAHEIAHTLQEADGTISRKEEVGWLLHKDGTLEFGGGPNLWVEVAYEIPAKEKGKVVKDKFEKKTGKKLVNVATNRSISGSLVEWIGFEKAMEEAQKLIGGDPTKSTTYDTEDKQKIVVDALPDKERAAKFLKGEIQYAQLSLDESTSLFGNLIMDESGMRYDTQKGWAGELKLKGGKELSKYFDYDYKAQFEYLKNIGDVAARVGFDTWYANMQKEELKMMRNSNLYAEGYIKESCLADSNLNLTKLKFEELEQLYALHRIDDFKDKAVRQKFIDMYMYTLRKNYAQEYGKPTKCNVMFNDYLKSGAHKHVLEAIYATEGTNEVEQVLNYVAGGSKRTLEVMKKSGSNFRYENNDVVVFSSHQEAQDLANNNCDVGVFGKYMYNGYLAPHFSMVAPSNITFTENAIIEKRNFKYYPVFGLDIQPYSGYGTNPNVPGAIGPLLAQVGTANGLVNYFWGYNNNRPRIDFNKGHFSGIVYVYFKK